MCYGTHGTLLFMYYETHGMKCCLFFPSDAMNSWYDVALQYEFLVLVHEELLLWDQFCGSEC
jgi:hypothetical protein